jgi:hypothetical protein
VVSGLLEGLRGDALTQTADEELVVVPLSDAARQSGVIPAFVDPSIAIISTDPYEVLTDDLVPTIVERASVFPLQE